MQDKNLVALRQEQAKIEAQLAAAQEEGQKYITDGARVPSEVTERVTKLAKEVADKGTEIAELEKGIAADAALLNSLVPQVEESMPKHRDISTGETTTELSRDTVDLILSAMKAAYGSSGAHNPARARINKDSEEHILQLLRTPQEVRMARSAELNKRYREIQLHNNAIVAAGSTGENAIADDNSFMNTFLLQERAYGGTSDVARTIQTQGMNPLPLPTIDDVAATGAGRVAENAAVPDATITIGQDNLYGQMVASGRLSATEQAINDSGPDLPQIIGFLAGERIARAEANLFVNGAGTGTGANRLHTGLVASFAVVAHTMEYDISDTDYTTKAWADMMRVKYGVAPARRRGQSFSMVMSDLLDRRFAEATDGDDRPIFRDWGMGNTAQGMGLRIGGLNALSDYSLADPALTAGANKLFGFVGDFNWFWIRRAAGLYMIRDPYTDSPRFAINWVFGRRSDCMGLFNTGADASVKRINLTVKA